MGLRETLDGARRRAGEFMDGARIGAKKGGLWRVDKPVRERIREVPIKERAKYRDVYEDQQIERSTLQKPQTMGSRNIVAAVSGVLSFLAVWAVFSFVQSALAAAPTADIADPDAFTAGWRAALLSPSWPKFWVSAFTGAIVGGAVLLVLWRDLEAQNLLTDTKSLNQYSNDQRIMEPQEVLESYDVFPDAGAWSSVSVSTLISHAMMTNKGVPKVEVGVFHEKDVLDEDGDALVYKGEPVLAADGSQVTRTEDLFDRSFALDLFEASFDADAADDLEYIVSSFDPGKVAYNPGNKDRTKVKDCDTVLDLIKKDWVLPPSEPQRPAGVYAVDTSDVNTMVIAMTRAGKGQTIIEPTIDCWTRELNKSNMVVNDSKGELIVKNYVRCSRRGMEVKQINLIQAFKSDVFNPIVASAVAARTGNFTECASHIAGVSEVFFPETDEAVWSDASRANFQRTAYALIDYYLERERAITRRAFEEGWAAEILDDEIDQNWGYVTLFNCYQFFTAMSSKMIPNPCIMFNAQKEAGVFEGLEDTEDFRLLERQMEIKNEIFQRKPEMDALSVYFNASLMLPKNSVRQFMTDADASIKSMGSADKMMSSVYGITITAMRFFTDPTIKRLTSGTLSQNLDLESFPFPRRFSVRFDHGYMERYALLGKKVVWDCYRAPERGREPFRPEHRYEGDAFRHVDMVGEDGWARCLLEGVFEQDTAYLRARILDAQTDALIETFHFRFKVSYKKTLSGTQHLPDRVKGVPRVVDGGTLEELRRDPEDPSRFKVGRTRFARDRVVFPEEGTADGAYVAEVSWPVICQTDCAYSKEPKALFLVTPPDKTQYSKIVLVLLHQMAMTAMGSSYLGKPDQRPINKTRYMLDEVGNLQSDGHGIKDLPTLLSIGLGQGLLYTLILQTLQQLRQVYGDDSDKIISGNTANIIFLKSTDDDLLKTLETMSGTRHKVVMDQRQVSRNVEKMVMNNSGLVTVTQNAVELPVISFNDLAFIPRSNSVVFGQSSPIWNRNETALPMSWRLFQNTIVDPGHDYSLQTIPTMSTAADFLPENYMPDFEEMLKERIDQAVHAEAARAIYKDVYGLDDFDLQRLAPDDYAEEVMAIVERLRAARFEARFLEQLGLADAVEEAIENATDNEEFLEAQRVAEELRRELEVKRYAGGTLSRADLIAPGGNVEPTFKNVIARAYGECRGQFDMDEAYRVYPDGTLTSPTGQVFVESRDESETMAALEVAAKDPARRVWAEPGDAPACFYEVTDEFMEHLASLEDWRAVAGGEFDKAVRLAVEDLGSYRKVLIEED